MWKTLLFLFFGCSTIGFSQSDSLFRACLQRDSILFPENLAPFFSKLSQTKFPDVMPLTKIVHIGDSHLQIEHLSLAMKDELQRMYQADIGNTSYWFPFSACGGYGPKYTDVVTSGSWNCEKMVRATDNFRFGISGFALVLATATGTPSLELKTENPVQHLQLLVETNNSWKVEAKSGKVEVTPVSEHLSMITIHFRKEVTKAVLTFSAIEKSVVPLRIFGFHTSEKQEGLTYQSYGVSGGRYVDVATRSDYFFENVHFLQPDLFIISLGTNDSYIGDLVDSTYYQMVSTFIRRLQSENPGMTILMTAQPDTEYKAARPASDSLVLNTLLKIARENHCAFWNFEDVMGGIGSIHTWLDQGLADADQLHFSKDGYNLQAKLLVEALISVYNRYNKDR